MTYVHRYKFFILPLLIFSLAFSSFALMPTKRAEAALNAGTVTAAATAAAFSCLLAGLIPTMAQLTQVPVTDNTHNSKTCTLDTIAFALAKIVLSSLTDSVINWAQNGFPSGGPSFAKDLNATMRTVADGEAANFLSGFLGVNICNPAYLGFAFQVSASAKRVGPQYQCTLTKAIANVQAFEKDFESGGWIGYQESMNGQNNPLGFTVEAGSRVNNNTQKKQLNVFQELGWGNGFFGYKDDTGKTLTPGASVKSALDFSLTSDQRQLELAKSMNEILIAITQALANKAFASAQGFFN